MAVDRTSPNCCAPPGPKGAPSQRAPQSLSGGAHRGALCPIPGGTAFMGTNRPVIKLDGEAPQRRVKLKPFLLGQTPVSNAEFSDFAEQTGYVTEAEIFGWSFVFHLQVPTTQTTQQSAAGAQWWRKLATSRRPFGRRKPAQSPCGASILDGCAGLLRLGGGTPSEGSRMGACRPWRFGRCDLSLGRCAA